MLSIVIPPLYDQNNNEQNKTKLKNWVQIRTSGLTLGLWNTWGMN